MKSILATGVSLCALAALSAPAYADDDDDRIEELEARIERLEETNRRLLEYLEAQGAAPHAANMPQPHHDPHAAPHTAPHEPPHHAPDQMASADHHGAAPGGHHATHMEHLGESFVGINPAYGFAILDHAEGINTRPLTQLRAIQNGDLTSRVTLSGQITVLGNYQRSNSDTKFGWLMRHPTSANQIGEEVSEFVVHSASLAATARVTDNITTYVELLYDPEQSFGSGTITDLNRNQLQLRRGWVMFGNLDERPLYALVGKIDTPFGLQDTLNPFTNSTNWHAFAGLAYGAEVGYAANGFHLRAAAIQGGAQFRSHNSPVQDTNVPSRVNNFAVDANYTADLNGEGEFMVGASYTHATAYCQDYPVFHFNPCDENNPAWAVYSRLSYGNFEALAEYAATTDVWPGTASPVPMFSQFEAVEAQAFGLGARYWMDVQGGERNFALSGEFSRFIAGDDGAPWERQDQWVFGGSYFVTDSVNLFGELIHTKGWVPLNFLSGGNFPDGSSWSERDAETNIITLGVQAAF